MFSLIIYAWKNLHIDFFSHLSHAKINRVHRQFYESCSATPEELIRGGKTYPRTTSQAEPLGGCVEDEEFAPQVQVGEPLVRTWHPRGPLRPTTRHRDLLDHPRILQAAGLTSRTTSGRSHWKVRHDLPPRRGWWRWWWWWWQCIRRPWQRPRRVAWRAASTVLLLAMFRLYRSTYVVLDTVVAVARSIQWNQAGQADKIANREKHLRTLEAKELTIVLQLMMDDGFLVKLSAKLLPSFTIK